MSLLKEIQTRFQTANVVQQLIYINIGVFITVLLVGVFSGLVKGNTSFLVDWFAMPSDIGDFIMQPWTIITYGFLHVGFLHILFNCLILFFFGRMFLEYFTPKQCLNFYLFGTAFGGVLYMLAYNVFPFFEGRSGILFGASAGVMAIVIGISTYIPNYQINLRFIGYVKLWHIAAFIVLIDLLSLTGGNAGGHFAHLGGALFGYLFVRKAGNKKSGSFDLFSNLFKKKKKPLRTVHKSKKKPTPTTSKNMKTDTQQRIDDILDKISKSGYDTLSKEEKEFLFKQRK